MAGDEARVVDRRERALRRGDVRHDGAGTGSGEHLTHDVRRRADRRRDDDELRALERVRERAGSGERPERRRPLEHRRVGIEAAALRTAPPGGERDRCPDQPGADNREPLDSSRPGTRLRLGPRRKLGRNLLLEHVEDRGEDRSHAALRQRPAVRRDERLEKFRLALGVDPSLPGGVLVASHGRDELEPPVQRLEQLPVERFDLGAELGEVAHTARR